LRETLGLRELAVYQYLNDVLQLATRRMGVAGVNSYNDCSVGRLPQGCDATLAD